MSSPMIGSPKMVSMSNSEGNMIPMERQALMVEFQKSRKVKNISILDE